ncbi:hypothetical protein Q1695_003005 [Nippostrongylus brasiliensis]|nr:hypothetical protein Q1695_003005 [Nippostrongylus brasiliensis]
MFRASAILQSAGKQLRIPRACFSAPAATSRHATAEESLEKMRARLLYQSKKRGILENDLLIGVFGEKYVHKMDRETLEAYDKLINGEHMEWDLYYYMNGSKEPPADVVNSSAFKLLKNFVDKGEYAEDGNFHKV